MSKQQKLSERLYEDYDSWGMTEVAWNYDGVQSRDTSIIAEIRALEDEVERLNGELETLKGLCDDVQQQRDALRAESASQSATGCRSCDEAKRLRAEVATLQGVVARMKDSEKTAAELFASMYDTTIRERDEWKANYRGLEKTHSEDVCRIERERDEARAENRPLSAAISLALDERDLYLAERDAALAKLEKVSQRLDRGDVPFSLHQDLFAILNQDTSVSRSKLESTEMGHSDDIEAIECVPGEYRKSVKIPRQETRKTPRVGESLRKAVRRG